MQNDEDLTLDIPSRIERRRKALTVPELAGIIGISKRQVYALVQRGHIPSYRIAGTVRLDPASIALWLRSNRS
jgi:excisionase family DNA binding protein